MRKLKRVRWTDIVERVEALKISYRNVVGRQQRRRPLGRSGSECEDRPNVKMDLKLDRKKWTGYIWLIIRSSGPMF
jgi:hypothetical protein